MTQAASVPPTLLIACPPHPELDQWVRHARAHGVVIARTHDADQAQRWLGVLQPDVVLAEPLALDRFQAMPLAPHCQGLSWQGELQELRRTVARWVPELSEAMPLMRVGDLCVDEARGLVGRSLDHGRLIQAQLPPVEMRLFLCLVRQPGRLITRQELQDRVWPHDAQPQSRTVDQVVRRLRKVLATVGMADAVRAQRGLGYQFDPHPTLAQPIPFGF